MMGIEKADSKNGYVLYRTWNPVIVSLPDDEAGQLFKAIAKYHDGDKDYSLENVTLNSIFEMMKRTFANDAAKYEEVCRKRSAAGKKGGRPPGKKDGDTKQDKPKETNSFYKKANKADIDMDIDMDMDMDIDMVKDCSTLPNVPALILNDGSEWRPGMDDYNEWVKLYSAVDVKKEFGRMRQWLLSNPANRKTKRGIRRFVTTWLDKEQNRRHSNNGSGGSGQRPRNPFNNFEQHNYDFDVLEKELLNGQ